MASSRRKRHQLREGKRQTFLYILVIVGLIGLMLFFGARVIEFIGSAALLISGEDSDVASQNTVNIIQPPVLDTLPAATSEEEITVVGSVVREGGRVELYLNGDKYDTRRLGDDFDFSFDVVLEEGENVIRARQEIDGEKSDYSESQRITFTNEPPKLEGISPSEGQEFGRGDQRIEVRGVTEAGNSVTVNGFRAFVENSGSFSYFLSLSEGDNTVKIVATNKAGLESVEEINVRYSP